MRGLRLTAVFLALICVAQPTRAGSPKIKKVLPHYLDLKGRNTLYPSLYERDAYQAYLRAHPGEQSGLRLDVHWKPGPYTNLTLRVELRGSNERRRTRTVLSQTISVRRGWSRWTSLTLLGAPYREFGKLSAWRATLWHGQTMVAELKSFLW